MDCRGRVAMDCKGRVARGLARQGTGRYGHGGGRLRRRRLEARRLGDIPGGGEEATGGDRWWRLMTRVGGGRMSAQVRTISRVREESGRRDSEGTRRKEDPGRGSLGLDEREALEIERGGVAVG